ncbi:hypothetical protein HF086_002191 [Spodoptera exigua]|uniref:Uncharacterized protein n=1 Tax=Spodoptera exigua TaxID=7107 RepID=A0A922MGS3_SPOEX|nr:hypothetical protein HF086_002191 [Spodoptera exigua]
MPRMELICLWSRQRDDIALAERLYQTREILGIDGDIMRYKRHEHFVFDPVLVPAHGRRYADYHQRALSCKYRFLFNATLVVHLLIIISAAIAGGLWPNSLCYEYMYCHWPELGETIAPNQLCSRT